MKSVFPWNRDVSKTCSRIQNDETDSEIPSELLEEGGDANFSDKLPPADSGDFFHGVLVLKDEAASNDKPMAEFDIGSPGDFCRPDSNLVDVPTTPVFEVSSAEQINEGKSKYILYTLDIQLSTCITNEPARLVKRYSDFENLHQSLKKKYPNLLSALKFPRKQIISNFTDETIAKRSRAFEQYLSHLFSIEALRWSKELKTFLYQEGLVNAFVYLRNGQFLECNEILKRILPLQIVIVGEKSFELCLTLCAMVLCRTALESHEQALNLAEITISICESIGGGSYFGIPLVHSAIYSSWIVGKEKTHLEEKLKVMQTTDQTSAKKLSTLSEVVLLSVERFLRHSRS